MKNIFDGMSRFQIFLLCTLLFAVLIGTQNISHAETVSQDLEPKIQYGDPGPPPVPDTPLAPRPGEIEDPALSGDSVIGAPDPALSPESVVSEPDPVVEEGDPLVEQPEPLVEQPEALVEQPDALVEQPEAVVPEGEPLVDEPEPLVPGGEPLGDREAEGRGIR